MLDIWISSWDTWYIPGSLVLNGGTVRNSDGYNHLTGPVTLNSDSTFQVQWSNKNLYLDGVVSGSGGLIKTDDGMLGLTNTNTYSGGTTIKGGYIQVCTDAQLGTPPIAPAVNITLDGGEVWNNWNDGDARLNLDSNRIVMLGSGGGYFRAGYGQAFTVNGQITGSGTLNVAWDGSPLLLSSTVNDYTGNTLVGTTGTTDWTYWSDYGTALLRMGVENALPHGPGKGDLLFGSGTLPDGITPRIATVDLNGHNLQVNGLAGGTNAVVDNQAGDGTYTLTVGDNDATSTFDGVIRNSSGSVALTKIGTGVLTLGGNNAYSGSTTINSGTLRLGADAPCPAAPRST